MSERLLTDEDFFKLHEDFFGEGSGACCEIDDTDLCYRVAEAQDAKTAQIVRAEMWAIFEGYRSGADERGMLYTMPFAVWKPFREFALKSSKSEGGKG